MGILDCIFGKKKEVAPVVEKKVEVQEPFISFVETLKANHKRFKLVESWEASAKVSYEITDALNGNIFTLKVRQHYEGTICFGDLIVNGLEYSVASYADKSFVYNEIKNYYASRSRLVKQIKQGRLHQRMLKEYVTNDASR